MFFTWADFGILPTLESKNTAPWLPKIFFFSKFWFLTKNASFLFSVQKISEKCHELNMGVCCREQMLISPLKLISLLFMLWNSISKIFDIEFHNIKSNDINLSGDINICSLQQTPIFNSWHFSEIFWTENKKDAFLVKNQNFEKKKIFGSHGAVFLDSKVGKMPKSAHVKNTQITVKT